MIAGNRKGCFVISKHDEFVYGSCLVDAPNVETRFEIAMNIESMLKVLVEEIKIEFKIE